MDEVREFDEREFVLLLISLYRDAPELWKVKSEFYMNKNKKELAINKIVNALRAYDKNFTEDKLKKKINILRTNFKRQHNKYEKAKKTGAAADDIGIPKLWYYKEMMFMADRMKISASESAKVTEISSQEIKAEPSTSEPAMKFRKKEKTETAPDMQNELMRLAVAYFERQESEADMQNVSGIITKGWAMKLNRLAPDQRCYAEKIINDVLFEGEIGTLTRNGVYFMPDDSLINKK